MVSQKSFLLFVCKFKINLAESGTLDMGVNIQYLCTLAHGEALHKFELLSADVENTETLTLSYIIKGLALYFFPVNSLSK